MQFIKSLILLIVAILAVSSAANSVTYKSFTVKDVTQSCDFNLEGGACTSNAKCGSKQDTVYSYSIASSASKENTYAINGFIGNKCDGTPAVTAEFQCQSGKAVDVSFSNNNKVQVTCVAESDSSDASSVAIFGFGTLAAVAVSALL